MTLGELLAGIQLKGVSSSEPDALQEAWRSIEVAGIDYDSRRIGSGFVFFAFAGARVDGRKFAQQALSRGAVAVVSDLPCPEDLGSDDFATSPWLEVEHGRRALAVAARRFYHAPDERVSFVGITGTNGKTTTSYLCESVLSVAGCVTGVMGTIDYRLPGAVRSAPNTSPESLDVMRFADELAAQGGTHLISEVSSHALALGRVWGFRYHTAVFTNLTRDHLDFHQTMDEYQAAKQLLFRPTEGPAPEWAVLNADDEASAAMVLPDAAHPDSNVIFYGLSDQATLRAENVVSGFDGLHFDLTWQGHRHAIASPLVGLVNVSNILAAAGVGLSYGLDLETIARGIALCKAVPGRFERVDCGQPFLVVVDYAHTDDALRNAIQMARSLTKTRVITLFGCGGDRDRSKRPLMGMAAAELSDYVVLTSDNPRSEDPLAIMNDAMVGLRRSDTPHVAEPDRAKAIRLALAQAHPGDVVLIAGKGHETNQILKNETIAFDDRVTAREVLESLGYTSKDMEKE